MHKFILKCFSLLKNICYFLKILTVFFIMLHLLYWIQNLINSEFGWLQIFVPILNSMIVISSIFSDKSVDLWGAIFEYKYIIAVAIYVVIYFIFNLIISLLDSLEDKYDDLRRFVRKTVEISYNNTINKTQEKEAKSISQYKIMVSTSIKKKFSHSGLGYDIDEQNKLMNKYLFEKIGIAPVQYEGGFVYSFNNFDDIDKILEIFFKLIKSGAPLDYAICLQVVESDSLICIDKLKSLNGLHYLNKIIMFSESAYRYKFNQAHRYGTSQLGIFQKGANTKELWEFIEI